MTEKIIYNETEYTELISGDVAFGESLAASALSVDTLTVTVVAESAPGFVYAGDVEYYRGDTLIGRFYMKSILRTGKTQYTFTAVSAIGLLDSVTHYGGLYNGAETVSEMLEDVVGGTFTYTLDPAFADVLIYGWLPVDTARNNLRQLLFAIGASITKDADGDVVISALPESTVSTVPPERIFAGGEVSYPTPATAVLVTEHSYAPSDAEPKELYGGEVIAGSIVSPKGESLTGQLVTFPEPHYDFSCTGAEILESGANYAVLSPSASATLYGRGYEHGTKELRMDAEDASGTEYIPKCSDCTLISLANSRNVAKRMLAYYGSKLDVTQDIVLSGEKTGQRVAFTTPFGDSATGYIKQMTLTMGALLRGTVKLDTGYIPTGFGNYYNAFHTVTQSGSYTVPAGVEHIRIVLIGGGQGGASGEDGQSGRTPDATETVQQQQTRYTLGMMDSTREIDSYQTYTWRKGIEVDPLTGAYWYTLAPDGRSVDEISANAYDAAAAGYSWCYIPGEYFLLYEGQSTFSRSTLRRYGIASYTVTGNTYRKYYSAVRVGGIGGNGGVGGEGGKVHQVDMDVEPGTSLSITVGSGGEGGESGEGASGGDTTVRINGAVISSASGAASFAGIINILTGEVYGARGSDGIRGGNGGAYLGEGTSFPGDSAGDHTGGAGGASRSWTGATYYGGSGGGASDSGNGSNGSAPSASGTVYKSGNGGAGANGGTPQTVTAYGRGGTGGSGGGGGGNAGGYIDSRGDTSKMAVGTPGAGGTGGNGGAGAPGCVLIYYRAPVLLYDAEDKILIDSNGDRLAPAGGTYHSRYTGTEIDEFIEEEMN